MAVMIRFICDLPLLGHSSISGFSSAAKKLFLTTQYEIFHDLTFAQGVLKKGIPDTFLDIFSRDPERLLYQVSPHRTVRIGRVSYLFCFDDPVRTEVRRVLVYPLKIPGYYRRTTLF